VCYDPARPFLLTFQTDCYFWNWQAEWLSARAEWTVDSVEFRGWQRRQQIELADQFDLAQMASESAAMTQVD
jgi:hypothetical protein